MLQLIIEQERFKNYCFRIPLLCFQCCTSYLEYHMFLFDIFHPQQTDYNAD